MTLPEPRRLITYPRSRSSRYADATVVLLTPRLSVNSRSLGSREPGVIRPSAISNRSRSASSQYAGPVPSAHAPSRPTRVLAGRYCPFMQSTMT